ncbi:PEP-CTERM sorting domain-containing protein [Rhodoferax bucti]|uniref:PEP-CTERM sorting domain-containing protein n=1 Tax=Rhodoferax bucti TaxID=2576305 RepID=UPI001F0E5CB1|nr:PEP-CTERM sorting domain-containing protein [Rhodoferax bucti]
MSQVRSGVVAVATMLSLVAASPALAASASFASISNFTVSVDTGLSSFQASNPAISLSVDLKDANGVTLLSDTRITSSNDPLAVSNTSSNATAQISGDDFSTAVFLAKGNSDNDNRYNSIAYASLSFTLGAHSSITFGALSSLSSHYEKGLGESGYAGTYFEIRDALPASSVQSDSLTYASDLLTTPLSTSFNNDTDATVTKMLVIGAFVQGESFPVTPVPEPETYAMLLAGLGLMGAVARRRQTKIN